MKVGDPFMDVLGVHVVAFRLACHQIATSQGKDPLLVQAEFWKIADQEYEKMHPVELFDVLKEVLSGRQDAANQP